MSMTDRDRQVLEHILRYCDKIEKTCKRFGTDLEVFLHDSDYSDSVSMNLLQIGELAGRLTPEFSGETRMEIDWRGMRNMRNMFAHDYGSMDYERIWETAVFDIPMLKAACITFLKAE